jgi:predicted HTH transcriptional regulator
LEFKEDFPPQTTDLAKEVAAFATSGGGKMLLGVADNGDLKGLPTEDGSARDAHVRRAQGIVSQVRPPVKAGYRLAEENGCFVLCIEVDAAQAHPIFYSEHRPYVRDGSISRPASPDEVQQIVWKHGSSEYHREAEGIRLRAMQDAVERTRKEHDQIQEQARLADERANEQIRLAAKANEELNRKLSRTLLGP